MIGKFITSAAAIASLATAVVPATASAHDHDRYGYQDGRDYGNRDGYYSQGRGDHGRWHGRDDHRRGYYNNGYGYNRGYGYDRSYAYGGGYANRDRYYGDRYRCHSGRTGTIVGAIAGGLIGNGVAGRGDRTLGTVLGAGGGALVGRSIDRNGRC